MSKSMTTQKIEGEKNEVTIHTFPDLKCVMYGFRAFRSPPT